LQVFEINQLKILILGLLLIGELEGDVQHALWRLI
jgi:hypothetical protein